MMSQEYQTWITRVWESNRNTSESFCEAEKKLCVCVYVYLKLFTTGFSKIIIG